MPTRGTTHACRLAGHAAYFNPRAHEGHDSHPVSSTSLRPISIHVPTRGTTPRRSRSSAQPISIHVPTRGTTSLVTGLDSVSIFQSTCPRGARLLLKWVQRCSSISIHVPTRGTTPTSHGTRVTNIFQSTCPRGARRHTAYYTRLYANFNPRAHEGHDPPIAHTGMPHPISIHVPTRGTTRRQTFRCYRQRISIHVPTRGTTVSNIP